MMKLEKIREKRMQNSLSYADLARKLNIYKSSYYRKENGEIPFKLQEIIILKKELDLSMNEVEEIFF